MFGSGKFPPDFTLQMECVHCTLYVNELRSFTFHSPNPSTKPVTSSSYQSSPNNKKLTISLKGDLELSKH